MSQPPPSTAAQSHDVSDFNLLHVVNTTLRHRGVVLVTAFAVAVAVLVIAIRREVSYSAVVQFMPEGQRQASGVSSLAAQFGVNVNATDGLNSPLFYPELVRSPQFLGAIVDSTYGADSSGTGGRTLIEVFGIEGNDNRFRRNRAIELLNRNLNAGVAPRTGIVTISVTADRSDLARDIAARILSEITRFNRHTRQGRAGAERRFVEARIEDVRDSLRIAEDRLLEFLIENRDYRTSPTLAFRHARLERDVERRQLLLASLGPRYEEAKIEEVRDTPVLTILRQPELPVLPNARGRVRLMALGVLGGLALGIAIAFGFEAWNRVRKSTDPNSVEFTTLTSDINNQVRQRGFVRALFGPGNGHRG